MLIKSLFIIVLFWLPLAYGQTNQVAFFHLKKVVLKQNISSQNPLNLAKQKAVNHFNLAGHIGISQIDSTVKKDVWHYYYKSEKEYKKVVINTEDDDDISTKLYHTSKAINDLLNDLENTGFPFAKVNITELQELENSLELTCAIDSGQYLSIGKIIVKSPDKYHQNTIQNLIYIKPGEPYNESKINAISDLLNQDNYYELIRSPELLFRETTVDLYLTIKKKNSSLADGFIGFQQNPENFKLELNGNVNLGLKNGLNRGEILDFKWQSNPNKSQNLNAKFVYPFIANLPLGVDGNMTIQKQDTTFIRNAFLGSVKYLAPRFSIGIFAETENSFLLGENDLSTSNFDDYKRNTYGFEGGYFFNGLKKYKPRLHFKIGAFSVKTDSIQSPTSASNLIIDVSLSQQVQLIKSFYFQNTVRFQDIQSNQYLSNNQLFYFGGLKSVRGFYELELNGNHVFSANNAIVFKPVKQLAFELIYDYSQFHNASFNQTHSAGIGFSIENETNTLSIILANGTIVGNGFNFQNSKLHLGFISHF